MNRSVYPFSQQWDAMDCGPSCLEMVAKYHGIETNRAQLRQWCHLGPNGASFSGLSEAAEKIGFNSLSIGIGADQLGTVPKPCILHWENRHFVVLYEFKNGRAIVGDPAQGIRKLHRDELEAKWLPDTNANKGFVLLLEAMGEHIQQSNAQQEGRPKGLYQLWEYFKNYKKEGAQLLLGLIFGSLTQLALPFLTQAMVDHGIRFQDMHFVYVVLLAQTIFFVSLSSVEIIRGWILLQITQQVNLLLVTDFLKRLLQLPIAFFDSKHSGDIIQRIQDNRKVQEFVSSKSLSALFSMVTLLAFAVVLWYYQIFLGILFLLTLLLYGLWSLSFLRKQMGWDHQHFQKESETQRAIWQLVRGLTAIKLNRSEQKRRMEWARVQQKLFHIQHRQLSIAQKQRFGAMFIHQMGSLVLLFLSAKYVIHGELTLGAMLSIQFIVGQVGLPLSNIVQFFVEAQSAGLSLERMQEVHSHPKETTDGVQVEMGQNISLKDVSFRYGPKSSPLVLDKVSLTIAYGRTTAIVGTSGSGKTTLLKLLLGHYDTYQGKIRLGSIDLRKLSRSDWRDTCGAVMQEGFVFEDTLVSNITESEKDVVDGQRLETAIQISQLGDFLKQLPLGLRTRLGTDGMNLSGGERQRVLLARALYKLPRFFLLDEATSAMDTQLEHRVMEGLKKFYKGRTVLIIAHRMSTVREADHIVVLEKGKVVEQGTHEDLVKAKRHYYGLVKYQLESGT
ncbi:peptidase domain-containing ABC transporter [Flagellimonas pacifica]|nr:peptidase domain-containing ABC transporter [Allomuricauda parva]